ncbi:MAG: tetratricopeptide repeat protein [Alphaproteobacteria bacterium]
MTRWLVLLFILVVSMPTQAQAQALSTTEAEQQSQTLPGSAAFDRHDYATALRLWRPLAEQGNSYAQNNLGSIYDGGYGVAADYKEAVKWYRLSAEQGNSFGQYNLGTMYAEGRGVSRDYKEAAKWFQLAADQGDADARAYLKKIAAAERATEPAGSNKQFVAQNSPARSCIAYLEQRYNKVGHDRYNENIKLEQKVFVNTSNMMEQRVPTFFGGHRYVVLSYWVDLFRNGIPADRLISSTVYCVVDDDGNVLGLETDVRP